MKKDSNILIVPSFSDYHQEFTKRIEFNKLFLDAKFGSVLMKIGNINRNDLSEQQSAISDLNMNFYPNDQMMIIETPLPFIQLINDDGLPLVSLDSINQEKVLIEIKVEEVYPSPIEHIPNVMCENCKETFQLGDVSLNEEEQFHCLNCLKLTNGKVHFNAFMKCREKTSDQIAMIHVCSYDDEGESFYGLKHYDLNKTTDGKYSKLSLNLKELVEKDIYIKIKVEAIPIDPSGNNNSSSKKIYRLIGNYETNYGSENLL